MASGTQITFVGCGKWMHRLFEEDAQYNYYGLDFYPDKASLKAYVKAGCQGEIREDEEGQFVKLRRKPKVLSRAGKLLDFGPPKVVDAEGAKWPDNKVVGNGSKVEVTVTTYPTAKGVGTRLDQVKVLEWKEYVPQDAINEAA